MYDTTTIKSADDFIALQEPQYREKLEEMRAIIKATIPKVKELVNHQSISYKYNFMLVGIGTKKNYCSLHTMSSNIITNFKPRLKDINCSGSTIHFPLDSPLPEDLIRDVVLAREKQNYLKSELKSKR